MTSGDTIFGDRLELALTLRLDADLHIGSGQREKVDGFHHDDGTENPLVALVQRDRSGNAIIPATSLKGALRAQAPLERAELEVLLGQQGDARNDQGRIARLWLEPAIGRPTGATFAGATKEGGERRQGFVKTGVRIERANGAAEDKLLHNREMIGSGVLFEARALVFTDDADQTVLIDRLAGLLAPMARPPGLVVGGQHRQGGGRLRIDAIAVTRKTLDPASLTLVEQKDDELGRTILRQASRVATPDVHRRFLLKLHCEGPFISVRDKPPKVEGATSQVTRPLEDRLPSPDDPGGEPLRKPRLWPSSLLGVLRARAAWLAACHHLRGSDRFAPERQITQVDDRDRVVRRPAEVVGLSSVERLFGVAGWRGRVVVARLEPAADCPSITQPMTSVTIDRFTGGGIDQRLYTEETFLGARFEAELWLETQSEALTENDGELFELLMGDIETEGLELGHGASKGFGWFEAGVTKLEGGGT